MNEDHNCVMGERWGRIESELQHIRETSQRTLEQATRTNGRVSVLETWKDRAKTVVVALLIANPFVTAYLTARSPAEKSAITDALIGLATNPAVRSALSGAAQP